MLKAFGLAIFLFVALTLLIAEVSFSSPLPQGSESPEAAKTESVEPAKTKSPEPAKAKVEVPDEKAPAGSPTKSTDSQSPHPYNTEAIKKFDAELYGRGN